MTSRNVSGIDAHRGGRRDSAGDAAHQSGPGDARERPAAALCDFAPQGRVKHELRFIEELLVLATGYHDPEMVVIPDRTLRYALSGAALLDLALANRIDTDTQSLYLTDATPLGDDLLDLVLEEIAGEPDTRSCEFWVRRIAQRADELRAMALESLVEQGIMETDDGGFFALSRRVRLARRYPTSVDGAAQQEIHARVMDFLFSDEIPSPRDAVIISLAQACDIFRQTLSTTEYGEVKERIELIARLELVGQSVAGAIRNITVAESQAAVRAMREEGGGWPRAAGLPLVGNALALSKDPISFLVKNYRELGPVFEMRVLHKKWVVLAGREANEFMLRQGGNYLRSREAWLGVNEELGSANTITSLDGADHQRLRLAMREGYSRKVIERRLEQVGGIVKRELLSDFSTNQPVSVYASMRAVVAEQIGALAASMSGKEYLGDLHTYLGALISERLVGMRPAFMMRRPRIRRARRNLEALFAEVLRAHEEEPREDDERDLVDDLLDLHRTAPGFYPETDMFFSMIGPFLVGMDTAASSTTFMLYAILKDPELLERVRAEADELFADGPPTVEKLHQMPVTQRTMMETLRMYPIAPLLPRYASNSFEFADYRIPAGTSLMLGISIPHYLSEYFPEPERFDIDRYTPERREHGRPGAYAPFGLGSHSCLGQGFAQSLTMLNVAAVVHEADVSLTVPDYRLEIKYTPVIQPKDSFKVRLRRRGQ